MKLRVPRRIPNNLEAVIAYLSHRHDVEIRGYFEYVASSDGLTSGLQILSYSMIKIDGVRYSPKSLMESIEWVDEIEDEKEVAYAA